MIFRSTIIQDASNVWYFFIKLSFSHAYSLHAVIIAAIKHILTEIQASGKTTKTDTCESDRQTDRGRKRKGERERDRIQKEKWT